MAFMAVGSSGSALTFSEEGPSEQSWKAHSVNQFHMPMINDHSRPEKAQFRLQKS